MGKLPKSSRPDRRKPSETFNHPYQLNVFDAPLASSVREVVWVARLLPGVLLALIGLYMAAANGLPDDGAIKAAFLSRAQLITVVLVFLVVVEALRTFRFFDYPRLRHVLWRSNLPHGPRDGIPSAYLASENIALH